MLLLPPSLPLLRLCYFSTITSSQPLIIGALRDLQDSAGLLTISHGISPSVWISYVFIVHLSALSRLRERYMQSQEVITGDGGTSTV